MKPDEKTQLKLNMSIDKFDYPQGLEKFLPIDEEAIKFLEFNLGETVDNNIKKYYDEQSKLKKQINNNMEQVNNDILEYQENCKKLIEYFKGIKI